MLFLQHANQRAGDDRYGAGQVALDRLLFAFVIPGVLFCVSLPQKKAEPTPSTQPPIWHKSLAEVNPNLPAWRAGPAQSHINLFFVDEQHVVLTWTVPDAPDTDRLSTRARPGHLYISSIDLRAQGEISTHVLPFLSSLIKVAPTAAGNWFVSVGDSIEDFSPTFEML